MTTFRSTIDGTPCTIRVIHYAPAQPARRLGHPDTWEPGYGAEIAFIAIDSDGRRLMKLEERMGMEELVRIEAEALRHMGEEVEV